MDKSNISKAEPLVVGFGLCAIDYLSLVKKFPGPDEKHDALQCSVQGGGPIPTALCAVSKLGGNAAFIGKCGDDYDCKFIKSELDRFGVDTHALLFDSHCQTPRAFIWVDSGTGARSVVLDRTKISDLLPSELDLDLLRSCRYLLIDGRESDVSIAAAQIARANGAEVVLDAGSPRKNIEQLLPLVDYLVVSKTFANFYSNEPEPLKAVVQLYKPTMKLAVITLGNNGAVFTDNGQAFYQKAFSVDVVDTTGAGDVFHGAFIYGLSQKWPIHEAVQFASAAAALKCRYLGGRSGIAEREEVMNFIKENT